MAVGLAILTAYGSTTIDRLAQQVYATPDAYLQFIPEDLRDRPLRDPLVVNALEEWASREAAQIMVGLFVVAAGVTAVAIPPGLLLGGRRATRPGMLDDASAAHGTARRDRQARLRRSRRRWPRTDRIRPRALIDRARCAPPGGARPPGEHHGQARRPSGSASWRATPAGNPKAPTALDGLPEVLRAAERRGLGRPRLADARRRRSRSRAALDLHPLIVEDVLEGNQRAKIQASEGVVHIVLFDLEFDDKVVATEIDIVLGPGFPAHGP